jgi:hypothetical protein
MQKFAEGTTRLDIKTAEIKVVLNWLKDVSDDV